MENESSDKSRWNQKYLKKGINTYTAEPSPWLFKHQNLLEKLAKGAALDIACGNGRNSVFLAKIGFEVNAVDVSDVAIDYVNQLAQAQHLSIKGHCLNLETSTFPNHQYQVIINFNYLQRSLFPKMIASLQKGGLLIMETFVEPFQELKHSKHMNPAYVLKRNELLTAFGELDILTYREVEISKEGKCKAGLIGRKRS